jgi:thiamine-monophosphate kinase
MISEEKVINLLKQSFSVPGGIGDDAASFGNYIITKDLLVEDIHFRRSYVNGENLAYKALQVNLSDLAAMGAQAKYILLGIAIPKECDEYIDKFLHSFIQACYDNEVLLMGGDTTASTDKICLSITAIGISNNPKLRSTAKVGDIICVIGNLGHAHIGLQAFEMGIEGLDEFKQDFLRPKAALTQGIWLAEQQAVTAMMDISDGLFTDLKKLCFTSGVAGELKLENFKNSVAFDDACALLKLNPLAIMLTGGEDYGLLITVNPDMYEKLLAESNFMIRDVGRVIEGEKGEVKFDKDIDFTLQEFSHFGEL